MADNLEIPKPSYARNMRLLGYSDQDGRSDGQQIMVHRGYAYMATCARKASASSTCTIRPGRKP